MPYAYIIALVDTRAEYQRVFNVYVPIALGVFALIAALILFALLRYRVRRGHEPGRWHENDLLEGMYALVLCGIAAYLLVLSLGAEHKVDTVSSRARPALVVYVTAAKWEWHFNYPAYGIDRYSGTVGSEELVVPANEPVRFRLATQDVIHAFWIPELRFKHDLVPGSTQTVTLDFSHVGRYPGECAEFCGLLHSQMTFDVRVLAPAAFASWASAARASAAAAASKRVAP